MKANRKFTSFEINKLLKGYSVESEYVYLQHKADDTIIFTNKRCDYENNFGNRYYNKEELNDFPAFTWNEILWEYPEKFFGKSGDNYYHILCAEGGLKDNFCPTCKTDVSWDELHYADEVISIEILKLLQQGKCEEADKYFRKNCILINNLK